MKKATCDTASGIEWLNDSKLKDLDFADDIALLDVIKWNAGSHIQS